MDKSGPPGTRRETFSADLCVVGAGIVGLAFAHEARRRGLRVALLERNGAAVGASVRNFGHAFVAAVADGDDLACALRSRERWLELGRRAGVPIEQAGTLVLARAEDELEVLAAAAANPTRGARMLTAEEAGRLAPIPTDELVGAMHGTLDLRVDPRSAVACLARLLEEDEGARLVWEEAVLEIEPGAVHGARTTVEAPRLLVCPGPDYAMLPLGCTGRLDGLTLCKLQMLRVEAPTARRCAPTLATGLSTIRYPAFTAQPASSRVRERLAAERPELLAAGIHLLVAQLPGGDLVVGDTHTYGDTPTPFSDDRLDALLLAEAARILGARELTVRERWIGVYPCARNGGGGHFAVGAPFAGARVVEVTSGLGMTMALGGVGPLLDALETDA